MPLSDRPGARARQLDNLRRGGTVVRGNQNARRHGGYARLLPERLDAKVHEVFTALSEDVPLREAGELPRADTVAVRMLAEALCRLEDVTGDLRDHGWQDRKTGQPRPAVELEGRLRREVGDWLRELGMTPRARATLGLDLARGFDLAAEMTADAQREALGG